MNTSEIKKMLISSLNSDAEHSEASRKLVEEGIAYDFSEDFTENILNRIAKPVPAITREGEFMKYMNIAFYRVALTGVAAIVVLLVSIFLMEGSLSFNSFLGLSDNYDESIVCLLTGN